MSRRSTLQRLDPIGSWGGLHAVSRLVYTTPGPDGTSVTATGLVCLPDGPAPAEGWRVVAWTHGTSGLSEHCGLTGSPDLEAGTGEVIGRLNAAGYAVVAPDYLGLGPGTIGPHPYLHTDTESTATIDAVCAARMGIDELSQHWAVAGQSQGGHAALAAGHRAATYAPDLIFHGTAALAPASNIEHVFAMARPQTPSIPGFPVGSLLAVLTGMTATPTKVDVRSYLTPVGQRISDEMTGVCSGAWPQLVAGVSTGSVVAKPLGDSDFRRSLAEYMAVPTGGYGAPVLIVHGWKDSRVPLPLTLRLLRQFRRAGTRFEFHAVNAGHDDVRDGAGLMYLLAFLHRILPAQG